MMSIMERENENNEEDEDSVSPNLLLRDKKLTGFVTNLLATAENLKILESLPGKVVHYHCLRSVDCFISWFCYAYP